MEFFSIDCPNCKAHIHIPFMRELKAKALEEADLAELTARDELSMLRGWLNSVSLLGLFKHWWYRR